jgi:hypothetical protein
MNVPVLKHLILCCPFIFLLSVPQIPAEQRDYFLPRPFTEKYVVIMTGAAAENKYAQRFREWSFRLFDVLTTSYGYRPDHIILLLGNGDPTEPRVSGACRKETIMENIRHLAAATKPRDQILFFLIGHGTINEGGAKFNIVGPDITGEVFAQLLEGFSQQDVIVVNTTSASHPFCAEVSAPGRVIISATRSRSEKYDTVFAKYFIEALEEHRADRDKNTRLSIWEAFQYAKLQVEKWYTDQDRIPSEHPTLDDNGDSVLNTRPEPMKNDGRLAQIAYLDVLPKTSSSTGDGELSVSPAEIELTRRAHELERAVFLLRNRKGEMSTVDYKIQMEVLLIDLAKTSRDLRKIQN